MYSTHLGANQPFNVAAIMRLSRIPPDGANAMISASAHEHVATKVRTIVGMQCLRQARHGPRPFDSTVLKPGGLVVNRVQKAQANRYARGSIKREIEPGHHSRHDVNC